MFKHHFLCYDESLARAKIEHIMSNDSPYGSFLGSKLYKSGIHFTSCNETIKGFYLDENEGSARGASIRICFEGQFVTKDGEHFFDVLIYPKIIEIVFLILAAVFMIYFGKMIGLIMGVVVLTVFTKGYHDLICETKDVLSNIFK